MKKTRKKFLILVQSVSGVITNSSSEVYQIRTDLDQSIFRELWDNILRNWGYPEEEISNDSTISGNIYREEGNLVLDYAIMCNLDHSAFDKLCDIFGKDNVKDITWDNW